jgi:phosphohistidine phosphatase
LNLYLVRHGLANWPNWAHDDDARPLTPAGVEAIRAAGRGLAMLGLEPEFVLHSPLVRARETASHLALALGVSDRLRECGPLRPGFDQSRLKHLLSEYAHCEALMWVGHNPDMSNAVQTLTGGEVKLPEGAVACIKVNKPESPSSGPLLWLATAEILAGLAAGRG